MQHFVWTDDQVRMALDISPSKGRSVSFQSVTTDSRSTQEGDLFVALKGDRFDGHDYVSDALHLGARGAVISRRVQADDETLMYEVGNTLEALGQLARYRRTHLEATVVGITGSSGKTGTKDLTRAVLDGTHRLHATSGTRNNRIGLPLTLLDAPDDVEVIVLEMGTNEFGEIRALTEIAQPRIGVVTTVSETHIEKLESIDGVLHEKLDLLDGLSSDGMAVVSDEPPILGEMALRLRPDTLVAGLSERAHEEFRPDQPIVDSKGYWRFLWRGESVRLLVPGLHSLRNALLALTVAELLEVPAAEAAHRVSQVEASEMRSEIRHVGNLTLILDCYNANPQSTRAALKLLETIESEGPKIAFLGTMLELGARAEDLHATLLAEARAMDVDVVVATGAFSVVAKKIEDWGLVAVFDPLEAYRALRDRLVGDEVILLKASREVALEQVIPLFEDDFGADKPDLGKGKA